MLQRQYSGNRFTASLCRGYGVTAFGGLVLDLSALGTGTVKLNGVDVSAIVRRVTIDAEAGRPTRVELTLEAACVEARLGDPNVRMLVDRAYQRDEGPDVRNV
jgi:hypothetical protein